MMRWTPLAALALMYAPLWVDLMQLAWRGEGEARIVLVALVIPWLLWRQRRSFAATAGKAPGAGALLLGLGLMLYLGGRVLEADLLTFASQLPVIAGLALIMGGMTWLRQLAFPLCFLPFAAPLPGEMLALLTAPMKMWLSATATDILHAAGYPVARDGVIIYLSQYRLLVDDACSGVYSLLSLAAIGVLHAHLAGAGSPLRQMALLAAIAPIAMLANLARVLLLLLLTWYGGDDVGQGPAHDLSGVLMFVLALLLMFSIEKLLPRRRPTPPAAAAGAAPRPASLRPPRGLRRATVLMTLTALTTLTLLAQRDEVLQETMAPDLARFAPISFGAWRGVAANVVAAPDAPWQSSLQRIYVDDQNRRVMVAIVHDARQFGDRWQLHRPEYCYRSQGFVIKAVNDGRLTTPWGNLPLRRMQAQRPGRSEPVSYWMTIGDDVALPGMTRKLAQLRNFFSGGVPQGVLLRVSTFGDSLAAAQPLHDEFIREFLAASSPAARRLFTGFGAAPAAAAAGAAPDSAAAASVIAAG